MPLSGPLPPPEIPPSSLLLRGRHGTPEMPPPPAMLPAPEMPDMPMPPGPLLLRGRHHTPEMPVYPCST